MQKAPHEFSPHYRTSIAFRPMARGELESFLGARGLWSPDPLRLCFFSVGMLNRICASNRVVLC